MMSRNRAWHPRSNTLFDALDGDDRNNELLVGASNGKLNGDADTDHLFGEAGHTVLGNDWIALGKRKPGQPLFIENGSDFPTTLEPDVGCSPSFRPPKAVDERQDCRCW